jgi:hypothetical protein
MLSALPVSKVGKHIEGGFHLAFFLATSHPEEVAKKVSNNRFFLLLHHNSPSFYSNVFANCKLLTAN